MDGKKFNPDKYYLFLKFKNTNSFKYVNMWPLTVTTYKNLLNLNLFLSLADEPLNKNDFVKILILGFCDAGDV